MNAERQRLIRAFLSVPLLLPGFSRLATARPSPASAEIVWQLGQFNQSSAEFSDA